ncbi:MAG: aldehyde:ferredoxin oxidoreductase [Chloroflexi bacterium]|nr:MAG: aldehyde:ferredoxin oxidoreductase [Anaerolineaceae bacterium 4572_32.2]RLC74071.1 MAG: aldehyde:ferredoxin oxidoreductase [Chloroflexota bacterium]RLC78034.1 MAG: aldehyde:ferredoxin oxidoreductase [Chloroflexota bacterium]HEY72632.1 aldehyde:ferredoxin oxidoreductase [Thermoflexia bacterium]
MNIQTMKQAHKVLAEFTYEPGTVDQGYAGQTLHVNLSDNTITSKPVTQQMKDIFIGGRGFGLRLLWDGISADTKWDDPENEIVISSGPLGGTIGYPGAGKSLVVSLSPLTNCVMDSNVGGYYGPLLKFSGWDAIEVQGKAEKDVIVFVDGDKGRVTIEEAPEEAVDSHVLGEQMAAMFADDEKGKRAVSSVSAGTGAEHALFGCLNFSWYDARRGRMRYKQAGRGGIGTVFRDKKVKALVVKLSNVKSGLNNPADPALLREVGHKVNEEMRRLDPIQNDMAGVGTAHLVSIMNDYDLLPTHNFKYGAHPEAYKISADVYRELYKPAGIPDGCWYGCTMACAKAIEGVTLRSGPYKGQVVGVDGPEYETIAGCGSSIGVFDPLWVTEFNFYCDTYGLDTISFGTSMAFVMECYEAGIINKEITGGLELNFRNAEAAAELLHQTARGEGFGLIFGQGIRRMKKIFAEKYGGDPQFLQDIGMESKGLEYSEYVTKESLAMQGGYGLTLKGPQHDEAWLIFMDQVNNQIPTFEDKAEALHYYPMWRTWFGLNGLCKIIWNDVSPEDNATTDEPAKIPAHVQNFVQFYNAVTGRELTKEDIIVQSERMYNFQRVFNIRMGHGLRSNDAIPYRSAGPVTVEEYKSRAERYDKQLGDIVGFDPAGKSTEEKMAALRVYREDQYEQLTDAVYKRRGWTPDGVPTLEKLQELGIDFPEVVEVVKPYLS